jgi:glycosyltransferase involved in cell wall biosynthesis
MRAPEIAFLIHGGPASIEAQRARGLAAAWPAAATRFLYRTADRRATARAWWREITARPPALLYVLNTALPGVPVALRAWLTRRLPYVLDTGDLVFEMARAAGSAPLRSLPLLWAAEWLGQKHAAAVVVRGSAHRALLRARGFGPVHLLRDGFNPDQNVAPERVAELRRSLGLEHRFVIGVLGSLVRSEKLNLCYGWDALEALPRLRDLPVKLLLVGDGNGQAWLRARAEALGVADRVVFAGRVPYADVPAYLRVFDVALSTQTNNRPGQVRTTGKLPEYMAAGRFILASRVGEAARLLPESMLLDYDGTVDPGYPARLAARLRELVADPAARAEAATLPGIARRGCDYAVLAPEFARLVRAALRDGAG